MNLADLVRQALEGATTDAELAEALASEQILPRVLDKATWTDQQVQEALHYADGTLKAIRRKSAAFPAPATEGRRWRRAEILAYRREHTRQA